LTAVFRTQIFKEILKLKKDKVETNFRLQVLAYSFLLVSEVIFFLILMSLLFVIVRGFFDFNEKWSHSKSERNGMSVTRDELRLESSTGVNDRAQESADLVD